MEPRGLIMKNKRVLYIVLLICLVLIGSVCIYLAVRPGEQKTNQQGSEGTNESGMMHGATDSDEKNDTDDVNGSQETEDSQSSQGGQTEWNQEEEKEQDDQKSEQKNEEDNKPEQEDNVPEENKTPQPNTETGWGPIT